MRHLGAVGAHTAATHTFKERETDRTSPWSDDRNVHVFDSRSQCSTTDDDPLHFSEAPGRPEVLGRLEVLVAVTDLAAPELELDSRFGANLPHDGTKVLLITEGGYPYRFGGVSTWCRLLIGGLHDIDYSLLAITGDPDSEPIFELPPNVRSLIRVPLWGTMESHEARRDLTLRDLRHARRAADESAVEAGLVPAYRALIDALLAEVSDPIELGRHVNTLYEFFLNTDFDNAMRCEAVWNAFLASAEQLFPSAAERAGYRDPPLALSDAMTGMHWVYHWLFPIARPLPAVEVVHTTMAGSCTLAAIALKLHHRARFVFSEHGIYLRETYLAEASDRGSPFLKLLKLGFARRMSELSYASADQISSCCDYNKRWQSRIWAPSHPVSTVYYGLDPDAFRPSPSAETTAPVVLWMGRIHPIKDLETLLQAASLVHNARPDVIFRMYGSPEPSSVWYYERLLDLRGSLGLDKVVEFRGYTSDAASAYADADVVALCSVSEGFPYSTLEAMLCGKPVVATSVGGLDEQLGDCGVLVEPRNPAELAKALLGILDDPARARRIGESARERAKGLFNLQVQNRRIAELYSADADPHLTETRAPSRENLPEVRADDPATVTREIGALAGRISDSVPHPVDELEVATVIEADGINDAVARARYGAENVFQLGEELLIRLRADTTRVALGSDDVVAPSRGSERLPELGRGILLVFPAAVVILMGHLLTKVPGWTPGTGRAFMLGVTSSMVITNAVLFGIVRRSSLLIGCGRWRGARRFLWRTTWVTATIMLTGEVIGLSIAGQIGGFGGSELTVFALSFTGLALFWITSAGFVALDRSQEPGIAVAVALVVGILVDTLLAAGYPRHLEIAILVSFLTTLCLIGVRVGYLFTRDRGGPDAYQRPRTSFVIDEALPYSAYGGLVIVLLLGPTLLTVFAGSFPSASAADLYTVAVGMTLALLPLAISLFAADDAIRESWEIMYGGLSTTDLRGSTAFATELYRWHSDRRWRFLAQVAIISALCIPAIWFLADTAAFRALGVSSRGLLVAAFVVSLLSYIMFASAQFDSATTLILGRAPLAVRSLAAGVLTAVIVAVGTFALEYPLVGVVALFAGTTVFAVTANLSTRRFFRDLAFHVASSM